jgi:hypothetical protein
MLNFTLTITAAPELLSAVSNFSNAITCAKVAAAVNSSKEQITSAPAYMVQAQQAANIQTSPAQTPTAPASTQTYTMEQLAVAATQIVDAGRRTELVSLLNSFGVQALTALPKEHYGAFATQLRALGAKIDNLCVQQRNTAGAKI